MNITALLFLLVTGIANAQNIGNPEDDERAREFFISGKSLYQEGRYRDALVAFETAYRKSSRPAILRSIAYCHEKLGEFESALAVLRRYRGLTDDEDKIESIDQAIKRIESQMLAILEADLKKSEAEAVEPPPETRSVNEPVPPPQPEPVYEERPRWRVGAGPIVLYSFAGVGAVVGGIFAVQAGRARTETAALCSQGDAIFCRDTAAKSINQDWLYSLIADTGFGVAAAGAVAGTIWMVHENASPTNVQVGVGLNGVQLKGRF